MNHHEALAQRHTPDRIDKHPTCTGELVYATAGFWDDVSWVCYRCTGCGQLIATVEGRLHWWNYVVSEASTKRLFPYGLGDQTKDEGDV